MIAVKNLSKSYHRQTVLKNINLRLKPGIVYLLLGPSGSGKSTLLNILSNLENPCDGSYHTTGTVGMIFQQYNLFSHLTVLENITRPLRTVLKLSKKQATEHGLIWLKQYQLDDKAYLSIKQLSGGQKQRLAIARTLALQPNWVFFDEPTAALDPILCDFVINEIKQLAEKNMGLVITTHDPSLLKKLDATLLLLNHGEIAQEITSKELFAHPERYPEFNAYI